MTNPYDLNPAVAAARAILISQRRHRNTKEKPLTIREAAKRYKASKSAIGRHLKSMKLFGKPAFSDNSVGRPRNLDEAEERAVIAYFMWLERAGFPCNQLLIEEAANTLRASRTPPAPPLGESWYRRFLADNPQLQKKKLVRAFDRERAGFEAGDITDLEEFYTNLGVVVEERDIEASQMFNADECGIRISSLREQLKVIIVKKMLNTQHEVVAFSNRESSIMLGCANAAGYVRVFQLLKNSHQKLLRRHIRQGYLNFKRSDFISKLSEILKESFTVHNFMNGFEKSRIFPVDRRGVIQRVKEKNKSLLATTNPALQSLLPKETRFKDAREVSRHLKCNYCDSFSSPTRDSFGILEDVVCEAVLLNNFAEEHI
ncbi:hypothetical protein Forpe1208_v015563 [Fusarium oxysporum f. sp. rapae]|uniref:HTH CENPB-type domain-containing protein n=1 Tax=Fusarium oxysporum f. sp. rapae TaxID=485398 RepID=A0A8J5NHC5_FUSOX|nr:hypothetical protein Forpe1208_v015563 [Fusarium oxysporum f. sp. rapae]